MGGEKVQGRPIITTRISTNNTYFDERFWVGLFCFVFFLGGNAKVLDFNWK